MKLGKVARNDMPRPKRLRLLESSLDLPHVLVTQNALDDMLAHAKTGYPVEIAGYALGLPLIDTVTARACTYIDRLVKADCESTRTHVTLLPSGLHEVQKTCDATGLILVGYYHSHPGFSVFQSGEDLATYGNYYPEPYQIAIVVDSTRTDSADLDRESWIGFFGWDGNQVSVRIPVAHLQLTEGINFQIGEAVLQSESDDGSPPSQVEDLKSWANRDHEQSQAREAKGGFSFAIDLQIGRRAWKKSIRGRLPRSNGRSRPDAG